MTQFNTEQSLSYYTKWRIQHRPRQIFVKNNPSTDCNSLATPCSLQFDYYPNVNEAIYPYGIYANFRADSFPFTTAYDIKDRTKKIISITDMFFDNDPLSEIASKNIQPNSLFSVGYAGRAYYSSNNKNYFMVYKSSADSSSVVADSYLLTRYYNENLEYSINTNYVTYSTSRPIKDIINVSGIPSNYLVTDINSRFLFIDDLDRLFIGDRQIAQDITSLRFKKFISFAKSAFSSPTNSFYSGVLCESGIYSFRGSYTNQFAGANPSFMPFNNESSAATDYFIFEDHLSTVYIVILFSNNTFRLYSYLNSTNSLVPFRREEAIESWLSDNYGPNFNYINFLNDYCYYDPFRQKYVTHKRLVDNTSLSFTVPTYIRPDKKELVIPLTSSATSTRLFRLTTIPDADTGVYSHLTALQASHQYTLTNFNLNQNAETSVANSQYNVNKYPQIGQIIDRNFVQTFPIPKPHIFPGSSTAGEVFIENHKNLRTNVSDIINDNFDQYVSEFTADIAPNPGQNLVEISYTYTNNVDQISGGWNIEKINIDFYLNDQYLGSSDKRTLFNDTRQVNGSTPSHTFRTARPLDTISNKLEMKITLFYIKNSDSISGSDYVSSLGKTKIVSVSKILDLPPKKLASTTGIPSVRTFFLATAEYPYYYQYSVTFSAVLLTESPEFNIQYFLDNLKIDTQNASTEIINKSSRIVRTTSTSQIYEIVLTVKAGHKYGDSPGATSVSYPVSLRTPIDYQSFGISYIIPTRSVPDISNLIDSFCTLNINTNISNVLAWSGNLSWVVGKQLWDNGVASIQASISWIPEIAQATATKDISIQLSDQNTTGIFSLNFSTESSVIDRQWQAIIRIDSIKLRDSGNNVQITNVSRPLQNVHIPALSGPVIPIDHPGSSFGASNTILFNTSRSGPGLPNDNTIYPSSYPRRLPPFPSFVKLPITEPMSYDLSILSARIIPYISLENYVNSNNDNITEFNVVCPDNSLSAGSDTVYMNTNFQIRTPLTITSDIYAMGRSNIFALGGRNQEYYQRIGYKIVNAFRSFDVDPPLRLPRPTTGFNLPNFSIDTSNIKKIIHQNNAIFVLSKNGVLLCNGAVSSAVPVSLHNILLSNVSSSAFFRIINKNKNISYLSINARTYSFSTNTRAQNNWPNSYLNDKRKRLIDTLLEQLVASDNPECPSFSKELMFNLLTNNGTLDLNENSDNNNEWTPIVLDKLGSTNNWSIPNANSAGGNVLNFNFDIGNIEDFWIEDQKVVVKTSQGYFSGSLTKHIHNDGYFLSIRRNSSSQSTINNASSLTAEEIKYENYALTTKGQAISPNDTTIGTVAYLSSRRNGFHKIPLAISANKSSSVVSINFSYFDKMYITTPLVNSIPQIIKKQPININLPPELIDKRISSYIEIEPSGSSDVYNLNELNNRLNIPEFNDYKNISTQFEQQSYDLYLFFHVSDGVPLVRIKACTITCVFSLVNSPLLPSMSSDISGNIMPLRFVETYGAITFQENTATLSTSGVINCQTKIYDTFTTFAQCRFSQRYRQSVTRNIYRNFIKEGSSELYSILLTGNGAIDTRPIVRELTNRSYNIKAIKFRNYIWYSDTQFNRFDYIDNLSKSEITGSDTSRILWTQRPRNGMITARSADILLGTQNIPTNIQTQSGAFLENAKNNIKDLQIIYDKPFFAIGGSVTNIVGTTNLTNNNIQTTDIYQSVYDKPFFISKLQNGSVVKKVLRHFIVTSATSSTNNAGSDTITPAPFLNVQYNTPNGDPLPRIRGTTSYSSGTGIFAIDNYSVQSTDPPNIASIRQSAKISSSTISNPVSDISTITIRHNIPPIIGRILSLSYEVWSSAVNRWVSYDNIISSSSSETRLAVNPLSISGNNLKIRILPKYTKIDNIFDVVYGDYLIVDRPISLIASEDFNET